MKEKEKGGWLPIVGLILLIAVLFAGVKLVFAGLGYVIKSIILNVHADVVRLVEVAEHTYL